MTVQTETSRDLSLDIEETESEITVTWRGKSTAREPTAFLVPILADVFNKGVSTERKVVFDFRPLEYMNSSTITPIIRILDEARRGSAQVKIVYNSSLKWQQLSFTALEVFQTEDKRIEIIGGEVSA